MHARSQEHGAAAAVVQRYYAAINARDYGTAWSQWGENGPAGQTMERFQAGFAATRATHVTIYRMTPGDAGAGSIYQPVPVTVDAELADRTRQHFAGTYVVRRVNDVDGASRAAALAHRFGEAATRFIGVTWTGNRLYRTIHPSFTRSGV
ncbi:hypothetical protein ACFSUK_14530 [Sphingobium scionense]